MQMQRWFLRTIISSLLPLCGTTMTVLAQQEQLAPTTLTQLVTPLSLTVQQGEDVILNAHLRTLERPAILQTVRLLFPDGQKRIVQTDKTGQARFRLNTSRCPC